MKRTKQSFLSTFLLLLVATFAIAACDSNSPAEEEEPLIPNQEGFFVFGTNTVAEDALDPDARMSRAVLDPAQGAQVENMEGVYGKYMYIDAGGTIEFTNYENDVSTNYGVEGGGAIVPGDSLGNVPLTSSVIYGELEEDGPAVEVSEEGLYYTFVNTNDNTVVVMKVEPNVIGDATEGQWESGTDIPMTEISEEGAVFEASDVTMYGESGYRWRFSEGFHAYAGPNVVTLNSLGVEDYGAAWEAGPDGYDVGFYLDNIPNHENGIYTLRLEFDAETGEWTETKTKTGELLVDYSSTEMALIGTAVPGGSFSGDGTGGYGQHAPSVDGNVYTWSWEGVELTEEQEFIFLEEATWGGLQVAYDGANVEGAAVDNEQVVNAMDVGGENPNFFVQEGGTYDLTLVVDAETTGRTVTIEPAE